MNDFEVIEGMDIGIELVPNAAYNNTITASEVLEKEKRTSLNSNADYARWGPDGCLPTNWRKCIEAVPMLGSSLHDKAAMIYGMGLSYYKKKSDDNGHVIREYTIDKEVESFIRKNKIGRIMQERILQYLYFGNCFAEFILTGDRSRISKIRNLDAEYTRLKRQNPDGTIDAIGYSAKFSESREPEDLEKVDIRLLDNFDYMEQLEGSRYPKYALWSRLDSPGRIYYSLPAWAGLFQKDGWVDVARNAPKLTNQLMKKQFKIRYIIRIHEKMWGFWYKEWDTYTQEEQTKAILKKKEEIKEALEGNTSDLMSIRSIISTMYSHPSGKEFKGITVEPIDDKLKKDEWLPNSDAANAHIVQTLGIGVGGKGLSTQQNAIGAGSGSDKRVERINAIALNPFIESVILEPLEIIRDVNGWDEDLCFTFQHMLPTTLDRSASGITTNETHTT